MSGGVGVRRDVEGGRVVIYDDSRICDLMSEGFRVGNYQNSFSFPIL